LEAIEVRGDEDNSAIEELDEEEEDAQEEDKN